MQDRGRGAHLVPCRHLATQPRQHRRVLGKEADLARLGRPELEGQPVHLDRPGRPGRRIAAPATVAIEAQVRVPPCVGIPSRAERHGEWPVGDPIPEPFEPCATADVEEPMAATHVREPGRSGPA